MATPSAPPLRRIMGEDVAQDARPGGWHERASCVPIVHFTDEPTEGYDEALCWTPQERAAVCLACPVLARCATQVTPWLGPWVGGTA